MKLGSIKLSYCSRPQIVNVCMDGDLGAKAKRNWFSRNLYFIYLKDLLLFYVYGSSACMVVCAPHICITCRSRKRVSNPLALELETVVSCQMGPGN